MNTLTVFGNLGCNFWKAAENEPSNVRISISWTPLGWDFSVLPLYMLCNLSATQPEKRSLKKRFAAYRNFEQGAN